VYTVLYDRAKKIYDKTGVKPKLNEKRGMWGNDVVGEAPGVEYKDGVAFV
jgi:hypothetical protein